MTAGEPSQLRIISFGDLDGEVWGSAIEAPASAIAFHTPGGGGAAAGAGAFSLTEESDGWRLGGDGFELLAAPVHDAAHSADPGSELCVVSGTLAGSDVQCLGTITSRPGLKRGRLGSIRGLSGWFASDRGLELLALRPARARGHETDQVAATVFEPEGAIAVDDPRMSTTFRAGELPSRASLELWIGEGEEQYPRRAAAESNGDPSEVDGDGVSLQVTPLRCHTGGLDGAGVYVLARF